MKSLYKWSWGLAIWLVTFGTLQAQYQPITTVAGNGEQFQNPDGTDASSVQLASVFNVLVDAEGNYYFTDPVQDRVFKIDIATNTLVNIAGTGTPEYNGDGGLATEAALWDPAGLAMDSSGDLYIADNRNNRIRKIDMSTGVITTVAGTGTLGISTTDQEATSTDLFYPKGMLFDDADNLYFVDAGSHRIRKMDAATGIISTVAGGGETGGNQGDTGDGGPAADALLKEPTDIAFDASGNLYITDSGNQKIRKIDGSGVISTIAGNGSAGYYGNGINANSTSTMLNQPRYLAINASGILYFSDMLNQRVRKIDLASNTISDVAGTGSVGFSGDDGAASSAALNYPQGIAFDNEGNVLIGDGYNERLRKIDISSGIITTVAGGAKDSYSGDGSEAVDAQLNNPFGVEVDQDGNIYIADFANQRIRKVDANTGIITTIAGTGAQGYGGDGAAAVDAQLNTPIELAIDPSGNLYISDFRNHRIRKVDAVSGIITTIAGNGSETHSGDGGDATVAGTPFPGGIAFDDAGNLYFAEYQNHYIRKIDMTSGKIYTVAGTGVASFSGDDGPATSAALNTPFGVDVDAGNNIYIGEYKNNRVRKIDGTTGNISTILGNGSSTSDGALASESSATYATGVAVDDAGHVYVSVAGQAKVRRISARTGEVRTIAGQGVEGYNGEHDESRSALLYSPWGLALDVQGNLFIADVGNRRIRKVTGDQVAPSGYAVSIVEELIGANDNSLTFDLTGIEANARIYCELKDESGTTLTKDLTAGADASYQFTFGGIGALQEGTLTLSVTLADVMDNVGDPVTATTVKDATAPSGFTVAFDQSQVDETNVENVSFSFTGAELGAEYIYSISSSGDNNVMKINSTGTVAVANQQVSGINVSSLTSGTLTLSVVLKDVAGNTSAIEEATITKVAKAPQSISLGVMETPSYSQEVFTLSATASSGLPVTFSLGEMDANRPILSLSGDQATILNAGSVSVTVTQEGDAGYQAAEPVTFTLNVTKILLTVTADDQTKIYGDADPEMSLSYSGFVKGDDVSVLNTIPAATVATQDGAGSYAITASGGADDNYTFSYVGGTLTVDKATLSVTANDQTKTYGEANPEFSMTLSGFVNDDSVLDLELAPSAFAEENLDAGTHAIVASGASDNNYTFAYTDGTLTVNKAMLTVTADDQERMVGEPNAELTLTYSGFVNDEEATVLDVLPVAATLANETSAAGAYDITVSGAEDNNYAFTYVWGTLTVADILSADNSLNEKLAAYPVPLQSQLTVELPASWPHANVQLVNQESKVLLEGKITSGDPIDVSQLRNGVYILQLEYKGQVNILKVVK